MRRRQAFRLHYVEQRPLEEVAQKMDRHIGSVRGLLVRGRYRLQRVLADALATFDKKSWR